jgi:hypothetical protein
VKLNIPDRTPHVKISDNLDPGIAPEASEIFGPNWRPMELKPREVYVRPDSEWSLAGELADREVARLLVNASFDPPIDDEEIRKVASDYGIPFHQAEAAIRRARQ